MSDDRFTIKRGDTSPALVRFLKDENGGVVNLVQSTVMFRIANSEGDVVESPATILDDEAGEVAYEWSAGDTDVAGVFHAEFRVTYSDSTVETFPNSGYVVVTVEQDL